MLGLPYPPAYADPSTSGTRLLGGVNYASAAGGVLDETGRHYVCLSQFNIIFLELFFFFRAGKSNCDYRVEIIYET